MKFRKQQLAGGLRLITAPRDGESVTVVVVFGAGSKHEAKDINGISHFLEHELFRGTKRWPKSADIALAIEGAGGVNNAFTDRELTAYFVTLPARKIELAFGILSDMALHPLFDEADLAIEKGAVIQELARYADMPSHVVVDLWSTVLYGDQPAGRPIGGTVDTVKSLSREKLVQYIEQFYVAENTVIIVAGNFDQRRVTSLTEKCFGSLRTGRIPARPNVTHDYQKRHRINIVTRKTDQTQAIIGFYGYPFSHPDRYVADLLAMILGGGMSSRLFRKVRDEKGLAYHVGADSENETDTGFFVAEGGFENTKLEEALDIIVREYATLTKELVSRSELERAKSYYKGRVSLGLESTLNAAVFLGEQETLTGTIMNVHERFKVINAVTSDDIRRVAQDLFHPERLHLALVGPFDSETPFERLIERF